jgi:RNA polymerase sigma factor (sigma-70 family)
MKDPGSAQRLSALIDGNEAAWQQIVSTNSQWLYALSLRLLGHPDDAEDAVQECFLQAFRARRQLKNLKTFRGWLRTICVRLCMRKRKKQRPFAAPDPDAFLPAEQSLSPDRIAAARQEIAAALEALDSLPPRQRSCLVLFIFEELSMDEIAETLGVSQGAVKRYIHDARKSLRRFMGE